MAFVNAAFIWSRILSWRSFWVVLTLVNIVLANAFIRKGSKPSKASKKNIPTDDTTETAAAVVAKLPSKLPPIGKLSSSCPFRMKMLEVMGGADYPVSTSSSF